MNLTLKSPMPHASDGFDRLKSWLLNTDNLAVIACILFGLGGGIAVGALGIMALPLAGGVLILALMLIYGNRLMMAYLLFLFIGYIFAGKGFAYIGVFPAYVSEVGLALGFLTLGLAPFTPRIRLNFSAWNWLIIAPLLIFMGVQVLQTIPYIKLYAMDALRDAMMYLYAFYALFVIVFVTHQQTVTFFAHVYKLVAFFILMTPLLFFFMEVFPFPLRFPGSPVSLIWVKHGDIGVHLAGAGAFLLLRLDRYKSKGLPDWFVWVLWVIWAVCWLGFGSSNRAGMLAAVFGILVTIALRIRSGWGRPVILGFTVIWLLLFTGGYSELKIPTGKGREISAEQIVDNFVSIFWQGDNSAGALEYTKQWRLNWWNDIIDYTFNGDYFWTGKGYGVNLAKSDGYTVGTGELLRSPHNSHFNFLARSGVPGFALWVGFLLTYFGWLFFKSNRLHLRGYVHEANFAVWFMAYAGAYMVNASFDLVLESPFAAIPFWLMIGVSVVFFSQIGQKKRLIT